MDELLLHQQTASQLLAFKSAPGHAVMLIAADGVGKKTIADSLARELLNLSKDEEGTTSLLFIKPDNRTIAIDDIRNLQRKLQLKTIGDKKIRRIVFIEEAHFMSTEAQNALLKILEEPPSDTVFILTARSRQSVLPTIYSRTQHIDIKMLQEKDMTAYLIKKGYAAADIQKALLYSGNRLGLAITLLKSDSEHPVIEAVEAAKKLLQLNLFERLQQVDNWSASKETLIDRFDVLKRICKAGLLVSAQKKDQTGLVRWQVRYQAAYDAASQLQLNANTKLLLTHLFLQLH